MLFAGMEELSACARAAALSACSALRKPLTSARILAAICVEAFSCAGMRIRPLRPPLAALILGTRQTTS